MKQVASIILTEVLHRFSQSLQANARIVPELGHDDLLLGLLFYHEDGDDMFLRKVR
jgi:hypothetical protein